MIEVVTAVLVLFILQSLSSPGNPVPECGWLACFPCRLRAWSARCPAADASLAGRAQRALRNMMEAMFVFIPLALPAIVSGKDTRASP